MEFYLHFSLGCARFLLSLSTPVPGEAKCHVLSSHKEMPRWVVRDGGRQSNSLGEMEVLTVTHCESP